MLANNELELNYENEIFEDDPKRCIAMNKLNINLRCKKNKIVNSNIFCSVHNKKHPISVAIYPKSNESDYDLWHFYKFVD